MCVLFNDYTLHKQTEDRLQQVISWPADCKLFHVPLLTRVLGSFLEAQQTGKSGTVTHQTRTQTPAGVISSPAPDQLYEGVQPSTAFSSVVISYNLIFQQKSDA